MTITLIDVKEKLEQEGLCVTASRPEALWIADDVETIPGTEIPFSRKVCTLETVDNQWVARFAVFPPATCDVYGSLVDLQNSILSVFQHCRTSHVSLWIAFSQVIGDPNSYINPCGK
jgi:hypothetical protein